MNWKLRSRSLSLDSPVIMGVLNVTPDSFSDGGVFGSVGDAVTRGLAMVEDGAAIVDVGGESTRPGADPVDIEEELNRVLPVIERLSSEGVVVSVDTQKPEVARISCLAGAEIVNDVNGLFNPVMREVVAATGAGVVIMHMQGDPQTMQDNPTYENVTPEVIDFLAERVDSAVDDGVNRESICVDPGIGFGKTVEHNLELLARLDEFQTLKLPVMVGTSRKRFLGSVLGIEDPVDRDHATAVTVAMGVAAGARVFRVHEVAPSLEAARLAWAIVSHKRPTEIQ